jgi:hypothetical protein
MSKILLLGCILLSGCSAINKAVKVPGEWKLQAYEYIYVVRGTEICGSVEADAMDNASYYAVHGRAIVGRFTTVAAAKAKVESICTGGL